MPSISDSFRPSGRTCAQCGAVELYSVLTGEYKHPCLRATDGTRICRECIDTLEYVKCCHCARYHLKSEMLIDEHDHAWCPSCALDYGVVQCPICGNTTAHSLAVMDSTGNTFRVCRDCCESNYPFCCASCGVYMASDAIGVSRELRNHSRGHLCVRCVTNRDICYLCGTPVPTNGEFTYADNDGHTLCRYCHERSIPRVINDYSYKPCPEFFGIVERNNHPYMGIELEVDKGSSPKSCAKEILNVAKGYVYCKHDGSLDDGVEIVSHPCTLEFHQNTLPWKEIQDVARDNGFTSHDAYTCGLHVHVNRSYFSYTSKNTQDLHIAKILLMVDRFWDELVVFSRREYNQLSHWAQKPSLEAENDDVDRLLRKVENKRIHAGRYQAVNIQNDATIEFRLFRGTLNVNTLFATLQMVETICKYAKRHDLRDIQTMKWMTLVEYGSEYTELTEYLKKRGLIENGGQK